MQLNIRMSVAALFVALLAVQQAQARDMTIQISPRIGYGTLRVDKEETISGEDANEDALSFGLGVSVVAPFGALLELGLFRDMSNSILNSDDNYQLTQYSLAVGYQFESEKGVRFTPKVGRTNWHLHTEEGQLGHPGPEAMLDFEGYDYFWEVSLQKSIGRKHTKWAGITFKDNPFEFGGARSVCFTMTIDL